MGKIIVKKKKIKREEEIRAKTSPDEGWSVSHGACLQKHVFPSCNFRREGAEECARRVHSGDFLILYAATVKGNASL